MAMLRSYKLIGFSRFIHATSIKVQFVSDSPPGDSGNDRITGRKGKAIADPKLFGLSRDSDYQVLDY